MPPDTAIRSDLPPKGESRPDGRSTIAFGQNSNKQRTRDVDVRGSGRDFKDLSSTTHVEHMSGNLKVNVYDGSTFNPAWRNLAGSAPPVDLDEPGFINPEAGGVEPPHFYPLIILKGLLDTILSILGRKEPLSTADSGRDVAEVPVTVVDISLRPVTPQPCLTSIPSLAQIYVCDLLRSGQGLPCWDPRPRQPEVLPNGIVPGDVGTYSFDGGFTKLFNLWVVEDVIKEMAASRGNGTYVPLGGNISVEPDALAEGTILAPGAEYRLHPAENRGVEHEFLFPPAQAGGILAVFSGANLEYTNDNRAMQAYIIDNAEPIYRCAHAVPRYTPGDSLYIVTGCTKTDVWARVAYQSLGPLTCDKRSLRLSGTASTAFRWTIQPAATYPLYHSNRSEGLKNQTLFLQGFKLAVSPEFVRRMKAVPSVTVSDRSEPIAGDPTTQGRGNGQPSPNNGSQSGRDEASSRSDPNRGGGALGSQRTGKERSLGASEDASHGTQEGGDASTDSTEGGVECTQFPPSSETNLRHPSDIINELLLNKTAANFALCHDDDWRHDFRDYGTLDSKNSANTEAGLPKSSAAEGNRLLIGEGPELSIVIQNGVAYPRTPQGQAPSSSVTQLAATGTNAKSVERPSKSSREALDRGTSDVGISKQTHYTADIPRGPPSILDLPNEILGDILLPLPVPAILRSQAVCRKFNSIITSSVESQYRVALEISGLEDNKMCSSFSTAERLEKLRKGQKAWRDFKPQFIASANLQAKEWCEGYADLREGLFVVGTGEESSVTYAVLPERDGEGVEWKSVDMQEMCVVTGLNACEHDLMVIMTRVWLEDTRVFKFDLHMRQLSTGEPHPEARQPRVPACKGAANLSDYSIEVVGENLMARLRFPEQDDTFLPDRLMVFEWKTGTLKASLRAPGGSHDYPIFLEENVLFIANSRRGALEIWDLSRTAFDPLPLAPKCTLGLPLLRPGRTFSFVAAHGEPNPRGIRKLGGSRSHEGPYQLNPMEVIIGFDLFVRPHRSYSLFVHRKSILQIVDDCGSRQTAPPETDFDAPLGSSPFPAPIPWEQWGERNTKFVETSNMVTLCVPRSAGQRTVLIPSEASNRPSSLIIMDFNPWMFKKHRHALMEKKHEFKAREKGGCKKEQEIEVQPAERAKVESDDNHATDEGPSWEHADPPSPNYSEDLSGDSESEAEDTFLPAGDPSPGGWILSETTIVDRQANVFASPVKSELPCVCYSSSQRFGYDGVMMDDARILGLKEDGTLDVHYFGLG